MVYFDRALVRTVSKDGSTGLTVASAGLSRPPAGSLYSPLEVLNKSSSYGYRYSPLTGLAGEFHWGQDYAAACGTRVYAADAGVVRAVGWHVWGGGGNRVEIEHGNGLVTTYNHLQAIGVTQGQSVRVGEVIAEVGTTAGPQDATFTSRRSSTVSILTPRTGHCCPFGRLIRCRPSHGELPARCRKWRLRNPAMGRSCIGWNQPGRHRWRARTRRTASCSTAGPVRQHSAGHFNAGHPPAELKPRRRRPRRRAPPGGTQTTTPTPSPSVTATPTPTPDNHCYANANADGYADSDDHCNADSDWHLHAIAVDQCPRKPVPSRRR